MRARVQIGRSALCSLTLSAVLTGCGADSALTGKRPLVGERTIAIETFTSLDDAKQPILAQPLTVSEGADGRYFITDGSDNDIKVYSEAGRRIATIGGPGDGPGEFRELRSAQPFRDSLAAFDFMGGHISIFDSLGRYARSLAVATKNWAGPFTFKMVDDSLFLMIGSALRYPERDLLALFRPDGYPVRTLFNMGSYFDGDPVLAQESFVLADAADGVVFAGITGSDSLFAFGYDGRRLAATRIDPQQPLVSLKDRMRANRRRIRLANGEYVHHLDRMLFEVVALDSAAVALHVAPYDTKQGIDLVDGGTLLVYALHPGGRLELVARQDVTAGLFGRSRSGHAVLLSYASASADQYRLHRLDLRRRTEP